MTKNRAYGTTGRLDTAQRWALGLAMAGALLLAVMIGSMFFAPSVQASSTAMQESIASHGATVDVETAERVKRACNYSGEIVTVDFIGTYKGTEQLLTAQCADDGVSAVVVKYATK